MPHKERREARGVARVEIGNPIVKLEEGQSHVGP
jgi:hypothetical protein